MIGLPEYFNDKLRAAVGMIMRARLARLARQLGKRDEFGIFVQMSSSFPERFV
jgi:hypothetical protein